MTDSSLPWYLDEQNEQESPSGVLPATPSVQLSSPHIEDDLNAAPIPVIGGSSVEPFRVLRPEDASPEQRNLIEALMTALHYHDTLNQKPRPTLPDIYEELFYIWKMLSRQLLVLIVALMLGLAAWALIRTGFTLTEANILWAAGAVVTTMLVLLWFSRRIYVAWATTVLYCNEQDTGITRTGNRWLGLSPIDESVETTSLNVKKESRAWLAYMLGLNSYRIKLDSSAQDDGFLGGSSDYDTTDLDQSSKGTARKKKPDKGLTYVRDGKRLRVTVAKFQQYAKDMER